MKTIEISDEAYQKLQDVKSIYAKEKCSLTFEGIVSTLALPKINLSDEDIIELLVSNYNNFYVALGIKIGYELQDRNLKYNWIKTDNGLVRKKNLIKKDYINMRRMEI